MFADRRAAGRQLADKLKHLAGANPVVVALPRGGVPVGYEVASALKAPLEIALVRKIGAPGQPEYALGAVADAGQPELVINEDFPRDLRGLQEYIEREYKRQLEEIERRRQLYFGARQPLPVAGRTVILVDDGIATGSTVRAALRAMKHVGAKRLVIATPVAAADTLERLRADADEIVCLLVPDMLVAIGMHYADFTQVEDSEVIALLKDARERSTGTATGRPG